MIRLLLKPWWPDDTLKRHKTRGDFHKELRFDCDGGSTFLYFKRLVLRGKEVTKHERNDISEGADREEHIIAGRYIASLRKIAEDTAALGGSDCSGHLWTRALTPPMTFSTSFIVAMEVSPGVVIASAPCAAP